MKKILLLVLCCMFISSTICSAKIKSEVDDFTGEKTIWSIYRKNDPYEGASLYKKINADGTLKYFHIVIGHATTGGQAEGLRFSNMADIKIDNIVYKVPLVGIYWNGDASRGWVSGTYNLTQDMIEKIKSTEQLGFRCNWYTAYKSMDITINQLPKKALDEWKLVIDMTEPPKKK